ncbi:response regulator [Rhodobacterales bacterium HKCCSP123]|nr:response regulator [Rhodobacterales bacterium HKCCSP123]
MSIRGFDDRLARERRARLQAERLLAQRSEELYAANRKLSDHARALSDKVIEQREENAALIGRSSRAQAALQVATEKAVVAERRLWDSLTAVEDGFAIFDRDWRLVIANPAWMGAFDGVADVAPGASYEAILRVASDEGLVDLQGEAPEDWIDRMIARWEGDSIPQVDIRLFNGVYVRLIDKRTPEGDMVTLAVDITDTIRRERDLERARDEAEAATRAKSAFLANMSHEIRTPMNGVVSMAELLRDTELSEEQHLYAETIRNSGEALLVIINDILDYSKIDAGKLVLHAEAFDLEQLIHEIFQLMRPGLEGKALALRLEYDAGLPTRMIGDRGRVRQVLTNLVGNAVKFTEAGEVTVRVAPDRQGHAPGEVPIRVTVEDTGIGIAPEMQTHVFGEFNQVEAETTRRFDGTGLGLAITRRLVELMGGEIWLISEPGVGSCFGFSLRLGADPAEQAGPVQPLPADRSDVWAITGGRPLPEPILADLMRLGARLTETVGPDGGPDAPAAVLLGSEPGTDAEILDGLRAAGIAAPVLCLRPEGEASDPPGGVRSIQPALGPGALRAAILAGTGRGPSLPVAVPDPVPRPPARLRLLAAEDNKTNQLVFRAMLKGLDLDIELVETGVQLVDAARRAPPDVIFTDISMPEMDGLDATRAIRAHEAAEGLPRVPIVAMTAHAMEGDRERILAAGIDAYLTKPLKKTEVLGMIRDLAPEGMCPVPVLPRILSTG